MAFLYFFFHAVVVGLERENGMFRSFVLGPSFRRVHELQSVDSCKVFARATNATLFKVYLLLLLLLLLPCP